MLRIIPSGEIIEDILDKPGASARETESCSLRSTVVLQGCETCRVII